MYNAWVTIVWREGDESVLQWFGINGKKKNSRAAKRVCEQWCMRNRSADKLQNKWIYSINEKNV